MAEVQKEDWKYVLINGKSKTLEVKVKAVKQDFHAKVFLMTLCANPQKKKPKIPYSMNYKRL
ncbi:hypothetical protein [Mariniflexile sp.]|uniref:hypothetical protein n=1 Tax=Mariniflexile sp. TaxID=1979402 RepID=UPI004048179E